MEILQDHEKRIRNLENNYAELKGDVQLLHNQNLRMENLFLNESKDTKNLLHKIIDNNHEINKERTKIWLKALGVTGSVITLLYLFVEYMTKGG